MKKILYTAFALALVLLSWGDVAQAITTRYYPFSGDGDVLRDASFYTLTWSQFRAVATGTTATATASSTFNLVNSGEGASSANDWIISRSFFPFDTSALPTNATITSSTVNVVIHGKIVTDNDGDDWVVVSNTSQPSTSTLSINDYSAVNLAAEGSDRIDASSITTSTSAHTIWTLNATGTSWISKGGVTYLGFLEGHDALNSAVADGKFVRLYGYYSERTGTSTDPYLEITYTTESGATPTPPTLKIENSTVLIDNASVVIQ